MIRSAPRLAKPYVSPVLEALIRRLEHPSGCSSAIAASGLGAIGELSAVGSVLIKENSEKLFRLAIDGLQDQSSTLKRQTALRTLGQLVCPQLKNDLELVVAGTFLTDCCGPHHRWRVLGM